MGRKIMQQERYCQSPSISDETHILLKIALSCKVKGKYKTVTVYPSSSQLLHLHTLFL